MASELDRKFDAVLAAVTGPGGRVVLGTDDQGRAVVTNFPATLPMFFKAFCALNGAVEAVVAGTERLTFADLDTWSDRLGVDRERARRWTIAQTTAWCDDERHRETATWLLEA